MKKILLFLFLPAFLLGACKNDNSQKAAAYDSIMAAHSSHTVYILQVKNQLDACAKIDPNSVPGYQAAYRNWVAKGGSDSVLNHIILDAKILEGFLDETLGNEALEFLPVKMGDEITILIGQVKSDGTIVYSNIKCMFGNGTNPITKQPVFCPPPNCNLPNDSLVTGGIDSKP